jgi:hypothetical protein
MYRWNWLFCKKHPKTSPQHFDGEIRKPKRPAQGTVEKHVSNCTGTIKNG